MNEHMERVNAMLVESAKAKRPEDRDLLQTLLAADVPMERALDLVIGETGDAVRSVMTQYAHLIRNHRMTQFPEGSEVRRRLGMIADMLDPATASAWEY